MTNKILTIVLTLIALPVFAGGSAKIGGTFVNSDEATFTVSLDNQWEEGAWQRSSEIDYIYKESNDVETLNEFYGSTKINYTFAPKHYVFGQLIYDTDKFRADETRTSLTAGYGYKLLRTERFKASNEISVGFLNSDLVEEVIYRNSLWFFYKIADKVSLTNKYLLEWGDEADDYVRNETSLNYNFDNGLVLSLTNTYTEDPVDNNVLGVTIGVKW
jgi:putative salt-induced outer membrane protein YdiY